MVPQLVQMLLQGTMTTGVSQDLVAIKVVSRRDFVVDSYPEIFSKFKVSIRKHVEDGICLPTVAINRLSTRVSTR